MKKTKAAIQKQAERDRKREAGFVLKQVWVWPTAWEAIQKSIAKLNKGSEK
jgi:hypothetical protein